MDLANSGFTDAENFAYFLQVEFLVLIHGHDKPFTLGQVADGLHHGFVEFFGFQVPHGIGAAVYLSIQGGLGIDLADNILDGLALVGEVLVQTHHGVGKTRQLQVILAQVAGQSLYELEGCGVEFFRGVHVVFLHRSGRPDGRPLAAISAAAQADFR
jgi:hypothetical protein